MEEFKIVEVTPEMAKEWMERNHNNRTINFKAVKEYARQMSTNDWDVTGQAISFDTEGKLIDGQHRLAAVCLANKPVKMLVASGLRRSVNYDNGRTRSPSDAIYMSTGIKFGNNIMAAAALALRTIKGNYTARICVDEQYKWAMKHKNTIDELASIKATKKIITTAPILLALITAYESGITREAIYGWAKVVGDGIYEETYQETAIRFRNWWFTNANARRDRKFALVTLKAAQKNIKQYAYKETVKKIQTPEELTFKVN